MLFSLLINPHNVCLCTCIAAADKRKSTPLGAVAGCHGPVAVHVIQDGARQVRCARLSGDVSAGDVWRQLEDVERLDLEDASDELMASLTSHGVHLARLDSLSVTWTPMKVLTLLIRTFFHPHDDKLAGVYATAFPSVSLCVCVTRVLCIKTAAKVFVEILLPPDSPIILVFRHRRSLLNSDGFTPNVALNRRG